MNMENLVANTHRTRIIASIQLEYGLSGTEARLNEPTDRH